MKLYLGYDGAYVLSKMPLVKETNDEGQEFLTYVGRKKFQMVDLDRDGRMLFGHLKLKKFEVVQLSVKTKRKIAVRK